MILEHERMKAKTCYLSYPFYDETDVTVRTYGSVRFGSAEVQRCFLAAVEVQANFAFIFCLSQQEPLNKSNSC